MFFVSVSLTSVENNALPFLFTVSIVSVSIITSVKLGLFLSSLIVPISSPILCDKISEPCETMSVLHSNPPPVDDHSKLLTYPKTASKFPCTRFHHYPSFYTSKAPRGTIRYHKVP